MPTSEGSFESRAPPPAGVHRFRFGPYELDLKPNELKRNGVKLPLRGQPLQVLELLLRSPGEVVSREQLRQALWSDGTIVEFDDSLNTCIRRLRQLLGDDASEPRFIETIPRRGYRFLADVEPLIDGTSREPAATADPAPTTTPVSTSVEPRRPRQRWLELALVGCALLALIGLVGRFPRLRDRAPLPSASSAAVAPSTRPLEPTTSQSGMGATTTPRRPTGVLTFVNRSFDPSLEWVGTALPELLTSRLAEIPALRLLQRRTVAQGEFSLGIRNLSAVNLNTLDRLHDGLGP